MQETEYVFILFLLIKQLLFLKNIIFTDFKQIQSLFILYFDKKPVFEKQTL